jgi:hypothetical protein
MLWPAIQKVKVNFEELKCKGSNSTSTYFYKTEITLWSPLKVLWIRIWISINMEIRIGIKTMPIHITAFNKY